MRNFCEPWTKRLNLTLKKTIMTALDRPGKSPPKVFEKSTMSQTNSIFVNGMGWLCRRKKWRNSSGRFLHGPPLNCIVKEHSLHAIGTWNRKPIRQPMPCIMRHFNIAVSQRGNPVHVHPGFSWAELVLILSIQIWLMGSHPSSRYNREL